MPPKSRSNNIDITPAEAFEKQVSGISNAIAEIDCGAIHGGNWRLPCQVCIGRERDLGKQLLSTIQDESVRRMVQRGHDARDGNKKRGP